MDLSHVVWIGGPDGGARAAVAAAVAARLGVAVHGASGADFRTLLADLRALEAPAIVVEGALEPKSVAAVLHRPDQAIFVDDPSPDVRVLRLQGLASSGVAFDELVAAALQRLSR